MDRLRGRNPSVREHRQSPVLVANACPSGHVVSDRTSACSEGRLVSARRFDAKFGANRLDELPRGPGVYEWLGPDEETLYVGKAANLRNRLRQVQEREPEEGPPKDAGAWWRPRAGCACVRARAISLRCCSRTR